MIVTTQDNTNSKPARDEGSAVDGSLGALLRRKRVEAMLDEARIVRDWPAGIEQSTEGEKLVRHAMYSLTVGEITRAEQSQLFSLLSFSMRRDSFSER